MHIILESGDHADATQTGPDVLVRGCLGGVQPKLIPADLLWEYAIPAPERRHGQRRKGERREFRKRPGRRVQLQRRADMLSYGDDLEVAVLAQEVRHRQRAMV